MRPSMTWLLFGAILAESGFQKANGRPQDVKLYYYENRNVGQNGYQFSYTTSDDTSRFEKGGFVNGVWTVEGESTWYDENGLRHKTTYIADDKGFRATVETGTRPLGGGSGGGGGSGFGGAVAAGGPGFASGVPGEPFPYPGQSGVISAGALAALCCGSG